MSYLKNKDLRTILKMFKEVHNQSINKSLKRDDLIKIYNNQLNSMIQHIMKKNRTQTNLIKGGVLLYSMQKMNKSGNGLFDKLKDFLTSSKKNFKNVANFYRRLFCSGKSRPLEDNELHWGCHNFSGPGTILNDRTRNFKPYNDIDNCSKIHDLEYENIKNEKDEKKRALMIQEADKKAIQCYDNYKDEDGYLPAKLGISGKLSLDQLLSKVLGKPTSLYGGLVDEIFNTKIEVDREKKRKKITKTKTKVRFEDLEEEKDEEEEDLEEEKDEEEEEEEDLEEKKREQKEEMEILEQKEDMEILEQQDIIQKLRDMGYLISPDRKNNNFKFRLKGKSVGVSSKMKPYLEDEKTINRENLLLAVSQLIQKENLQL